MHCYQEKAAIEDMLQVTCRGAKFVRCPGPVRYPHAYKTQLAQKGRFNEALDRLEDINPKIRHIFRLSQYWSFFSGLLKLKRQMLRYVWLVL